ncbi:uncharacterized protein LOC118645102 isoform X3 [Monomorium pharaonis]|nr:uncharacterized protein LOC118645102 isoform X3 [Monomorium pharaonis]XP_036141400.1 uncharacterized protein LOC118645102 isoform X3 [Monomorium pharaonis]XP_036141401.1 uncharacterized protein LOC118645102 isoform X3 [Monomorium pharaonis]XP_036141402.1 uncharacterized protein LOC118645102 isoform X3 [Monomorium pharaonis]XP_036141403.1 uncharacterized protein LOC118645102 isoform X3 [Monomorium pharaonis]
MEEKSNTESESQLDRGFRKKVSHCISRKSDNSSNSSKNEKDSSESNDSIPELNKNLHKQDDINENIDDNNSQTLDIDEIPIFIQAEDNVLIEDIPTDNNTRHSDKTSLGLVDGLDRAETQNRRTAALITITLNKSTPFEYTGTIRIVLPEQRQQIWHCRKLSRVI